MDRARIWIKRLKAAHMAQGCKGRLASDNCGLLSHSLADRSGWLKCSLVARIRMKFCWLEIAYPSSLGSKRLVLLESRGPGRGPPCAVRFFSAQTNTHTRVLQGCTEHTAGKAGATSCKGLHKRLRRTLACRLYQLLAASLLVFGPSFTLALLTAEVYFLAAAAFFSYFRA